MEDAILWLLLWAVLGQWIVTGTFYFSLKAYLLLFVFTLLDILLLDGAVLWHIFRLLGSKKSFEEHLTAVAWLKPPVLLFQEIALFNALFSFSPVHLYYLSLFMEFMVFFALADRFHKLSLKNLLIFALLLAIALAFFAHPTFYLLVYNLFS